MDGERGPPRTVMPRASLSRASAITAGVTSARVRVPSSARHQASCFAVFPHLGREITPPELLACLRRIEAPGRN